MNVNEAQVVEEILAGAKPYKCIVCGGAIPFTAPTWAAHSTRRSLVPLWNYVHEKTKGYPDCRTIWTRKRKEYVAAERVQDALRAAYWSGEIELVKPTRAMLRAARDKR